MRRALIWLPLGLFAVLFAVIGFGLLKPADRTVHSAMIGRPLPAFALAPMVPSKPGLSTAAFKQGKSRLLNVFASWCIPCIAEARQLARLKQMGITIDAVAIRDTPRDVQDFLSRYGDPYASIGNDPDSSIQLALGSSGVPETFVIDGQGRILLQHIGEIRAEDVDEIAALIRRGA
ncbi:MAG: redoxin family protein [Sphingomonas sp.]|nr:redoxin family protein [Sphingomonas sp.]